MSKLIGSCGQIVVIVKKGQEASQCRYNEEQRSYSYIWKHSFDIEHPVRNEHQHKADNCELISREKIVTDDETNEERL